MPNNFKLSLLFLTILALLIAGCAGTSKASPSNLDQECADGFCEAPVGELRQGPNSTFEKIADEAPVFVDLKGQSHRIAADIRAGRKVVLVYWQSWCKSCKKEAPAMVRAAKRYSSQASFYGIVSGPDRAVNDVAVKGFIEDAGINYPTIRDRNLYWTKKYEVKGTPTIIVLGKEERVLYRGHRAPNWSKIFSGNP